MLVCAIAVACLSAPLGAAEPSTTHAKSSATDAVKSTIAELIDVLDDARLKEPERTEQRRDEIERIVMSRISYEEMAKRALGTPWSEINEQERREFVELFVQLLRDAFAGGLSEHTDEQVVYLGEQREDHYAEVKTQLKGEKVDTHLDFRLMYASGDCGCMMSSLTAPAS
jgi:phospholipid transport system substrate-binding protein